MSPKTKEVTNSNSFHRCVCVRVRAGAGACGRRKHKTRLLFEDERLYLFLHITLRETNMLANTSVYTPATTGVNVK